MRRHIYYVFVSTCFVSVTVLIMLCYTFYERFAVKQHREVEGNLSLSRLKSRKKIIGFSLRHDQSTWKPADDICESGFVFPSLQLNLKHGNVSVYFQDESTRTETNKQLQKQTSWLWKNLRVLLRIFAKVPEHTYFIDVYAGNGVYSLSIAQLGRRTISVEDRYSLAETLCRGIVAGHFQKSSTIINNFISWERLTVPINAEHRSSRFKLGFRNTSAMFRSVSAIELEALLEAREIQMAVLKIDMRSDDVQTILNSDTFFSRVKIPYVLMKMTDINVSNGLAVLTEFMKKHGLVPCSNLSCKRPLDSANPAVWPMYVLWSQGQRFAKWAKTT